MGDADFLSEAWAAELAAVGASLPEVPGATATVTTVVVGGPAGKKAETAYRCAFVDGRIASASAGDDGATADLVVSEPWDEAVAALQGGPTIDVSFMRGRTKVVGSMGTFMDLLPVWRSDAWRAARSDLAARTALPA